MSRALLVIDVQNEYFTGALPITHPAGHLEQILNVMDRARGRVPTVLIQHTLEGPDAPFFRKGTKAWELHPEVAKHRATWRLRRRFPAASRAPVLKTGCESVEFPPSRSLAT